jgi:hypothetical protein
LKKKLEDIIQPLELQKYTTENNILDYDVIKIKKKAVYSFQGDYGSKIEKRVSVKSMKIPAINQKKYDTFTRPGVGRIKPLPKITPVKNMGYESPGSRNAQIVINQFSKSNEDSNLKPSSNTSKSKVFR